MVDFRYHLVSIVAVFLALTTGIAIGATALNGGVVHDLNSHIRSLISEKDKLRGQYAAQQTSSDENDSYIKALSPGLIAHQLRSRTVSVVSLPGADKATRDETLTTLVAAGARVVSEIQIEDKAIDPASAGVITGIVADLAPEVAQSYIQGTTSTDPAAKLGALIGAVVANKSPTNQKNDPTSMRLQAVLGGLHAAGFTDDDTDSFGANLVVVIAGTPTTSASLPLDALTIGLARTADAAGAGAVVIGPKASAQSGGALSAVRGDARTALQVSTIDNGDRPAGVVTLVRALLEQLRGGAGQYGSGTGSTAPLPTPSH